MFRRCLAVALFGLLAVELHGQLVPSIPPPNLLSDSIAQKYLRLPLVFEPNRGQADKDVLFLAVGSQYRIDLKARTAVMKFAGGFQIELETLGGRTPSSIRGVEQTEGVTSYFIGSDPTNWYTAVPNYKRVEYSGVYPGVNLAFYGHPNQLEYDITLDAGVDPRQVRLNFRGASSIHRTHSGDLLIRAPGRTVVQRRAYAYQVIDGRKVQIKAAYLPAGRTSVSLRLSGYDRREPVVVDPILVYSTYVGDSPLDLGEGIAVDTAGSAYLTGSDCPTNGGSLPCHAFISKVSPDGSAIVYTAHVGGSSVDASYAIAVDTNKNVYITGYTTSADFPTVNPFQNTLKGFYNAFITKLSPNGTSLVYSTYLGGSNADSGSGITVNSNGNAYVTGSTSSSNFPVLTPFQSTNHGGAADAFVTEMSADGSSLVFSTYLGGSGGEVPGHIALDGNQNVYVTGSTSSTDFPISLALQATLKGSQNAYVAKFAPDGQTLAYSTYLGGSGTDSGTGIAVDPLGDVYITGSTSSANFPTKNPLQGALNFKDAFVTKLSPDGSELIYSTFLGGSALDQGNDIAVDSAGNAYVVGQTYSDNFPTAYPPQGTNAGYSSGFASKLSPDGSTLLYSTYLGSTSGGTDQATGIAVDSAGAAYVGGFTSGINFPTTPGSAQSPGQPTAGFITKIAESPYACAYSTVPASLDVGSNASTGTFTVSTSAECSWIASTNAFWFKITSADTGTGSGTVSYSVAENVSPNSLSAIVSIGPQIINVTQGVAPCVYSLNSAQQTFTAAGGTGTVGFSSSITCNGWMVSNSNGWFSVEPFDGAGDTTFTFAVSPNLGNTARSGVFYVATQQFTITEAGAEGSGVSPSAGSGQANTFAFTFDDPNGYADLAVVDVLFNNFLDGIGACYVAFAPASATSGYLYLVDDAGDGGYASGSPMTLPSSGTLQNSQCTISGSGSSVSASGNTLTLTLAVTFASSFGGNKVFYTAARSASQNSGWQALGTWSVPGPALTGPAVGGVSPARSSTTGQTYAFTFSDTNGYGDLAVLDVLTNNFLDGIGACYLAFAPASATTGYLYLVDDAGDGGYVNGSPIALPSSSTLSNSQCTINASESSVTASGNTLTLNLAIAFSPTFTGNQVFYLAARNNSTGNSGWQAVGSVTVP